MNADLSPASSSTYFNAINSAFNVAVRWQLLQTNPCQNATSPKASNSEMKTYDSKQVEMLIKCAKDTPLHLVIVLAISCGLRRGEILGLRWSDIDFTTKTMHINNNAIQVEGKRIDRETKTKTGRRSVALPNNTIELLKATRKAQMENRLVMGAQYHVSDYVCIWNDGKPFMPGYVTNAFAKLLKKYDMPHIRFHDLRHTHATLLLQQGIHPKVVQERLGHAKISITLDTYSHVLPNMQHEAAEKMDKLFSC